MNGTAAATRVGFKKLGLREAAVLLVLAWLMPFLVHLAPWSGERPLGAYVLPMFWAPLVAAYFYGRWVAVGIGLFAPAVNLAVTGLPALERLGAMSAEVAVFVALASWAIERWPRFALTGPLAYLAAKLAVGAGLFAVAGKSLGIAAGALIGLVILAGLNAGLVMLYPKRGSDDAAGV